MQDSFDPANAADHVALLPQHQVQVGMQNRILRFARLVVCVVVVVVVMAVVVVVVVVLLVIRRVLRGTHEFVLVF